MRNYYIFISLLSLVVIISVIFGFTIVGSSQDARSYSYDVATVNTFSSLEAMIQDYANTHGKIPETLSALYNSQEDTRNMKTGKPFAYKRLSDNTYQLCTDFFTDSATYNQFVPAKTYTTVSFTHKKGYNCIPFSVNPKQTVTPSITPMVTPKPLPQVKEEVIDVSYSKLSPYSETLGRPFGEISISSDFRLDVGPFVHLYTLSTNPNYYLFAINIQPTCSDKATSTCTFSITKLSLKTADGVTIVRNASNDILYTPYIHDQIGELGSTLSISPKTANAGFVGFHIPRYLLQNRKPLVLSLTYNNSTPLKLTLTYTLYK